MIFQPDDKQINDIKKNAKTVPQRERDKKYTNLVFSRQNIF